VHCKGTLISEIFVISVADTMAYLKEVTLRAQL
jgi:hypothetical protein